MLERLSLEISISEMQEKLRRQYESIDSLKAIGRSILSAASLIVSLLGALSLFGSEVSVKYLVAFNALLGVVAVLYFIIIALCVRVLRPIKMVGPIAPDWSEINSAFFKDDEKEILRTQLSAYLNAIQTNEPLIDCRAREALIASICLPVIVFLLLGLSLIPH